MDGQELVRTLHRKNPPLVQIFFSDGKSFFLNRTSSSCFISEVSCQTTSTSILKDFYAERMFRMPKDKGAIEQIHWVSLPTVDFWSNFEEMDLRMVNDIDTSTVPY